MFQSFEQFIACPNSECSAFSFFHDERYGDDYYEVTCSEPFQCTACSFKWRTKAQLDASVPLFSLAYLRQFDWHKYTLFGYLYKLCCSVECPSCKINIVREQGCKFMECSKCKYQFCWYCLDEFYTQYHYDISNCPFRYCFLHSIEVFCGIIVFVKALLLFKILSNAFFFIIKNICLQGVFIAQILYIKKAVLRKRKYQRKLERHQASLRGAIQINP